MAEKVKLSKDGSSIEFVQTDQIPATLKKFRQSKEIEGFYRFVFENDLQKEAYEIMNRIVMERKAKKAQAKKEIRDAAKAAAQTEPKTPKSAPSMDSKSAKMTPVKAESKTAKPAKAEAESKSGKAPSKPAPKKK